MVIEKILKPRRRAFGSLRGRQLTPERVHPVKLAKPLFNWVKKELEAIYPVK